MSKLKNIISAFQFAGRFCFPASKKRVTKAVYWQAIFGYSVSITWFLNMSAICYVVISGNERAPEIINAMVETTSLWGVALGVLGISFVKGAPNKTIQKTDRKIKQPKIK